jgi:hypothetical protein
MRCFKNTIKGAQTSRKWNFLKEMIFIQEGVTLNTNLSERIDPKE